MTPVIHGLRALQDLGMSTPFNSDLREPTLILITLNSGSRIGGFWGPDSYAGSSPNDGDVYLEAVYDINEHGQFGGAKKHTRGVLIRKDQYTCVELFAVPLQEGAGSDDAKG
jgi:hypothetical protein